MPGRPKGIPKTGGRKKGSRNKASAAKAAEIAASGLTPLDYMLDVMRNAEMPPDRRDDMAKAAAPYVHPKLGAIEHTGKDGDPIKMAFVTDADRARALGAFLAKTKV